MEGIYRPRYLHSINIGEKFEFYKNNVLPEQIMMIPNTNEEIRDTINFQGTSKDFKDLEESISLVNILNADDIEPQLYNGQQTLIIKSRAIIELPKRALRLNCISSLLELQCRVPYNSRTRKVRCNKYRLMPMPNDEAGFNSIHINQNVISLFDEVLITVRIYEPFKFKSDTHNVTTPKFCQEWLLLGSQYLTELRDKIYCQCNWGPFFDISETYPNDPPRCKSEKRSHKSGFFFITDKFYNDTRRPYHDYTEIIKRWAKSQPNISNLETATMENTKFSELTVKLGYPQVYQHHGNCEHIFTFSDVRLIGSGDCMARSKYPILKLIAARKTLYCNICGQSEAKMIVRNSSAHIHDPTYLCKSCFETYHYINGKKIGKFEAYRYFGNNSKMPLEK